MRAWRGWIAVTLGMLSANVGGCVECSATCGSVEEATLTWESARDELTGASFEVCRNGVCQRGSLGALLTEGEGVFRLDLEPPEQDLRGYLDAELRVSAAAVELTFLWDFHDTRAARNGDRIQLTMTGAEGTTLLSASATVTSASEYSETCGTTCTSAYVTLREDE